MPVLLGAALKTNAPVVALHLTRPPIEIPDRETLGLPAHFQAARGAYVVRDHAPRRPPGGTLIVQGTSAMTAVLRLLQELERLDSTVITTQARWLMHDWLFTKAGEEYALSADWDDRWRTGGTLEEVLEEARLSTAWLLSGIERFVRDRPQRLQRLRSALK